MSARRATLLLCLLLGAEAGADEHGALRIERADGVQVVFEVELARSLAARRTGLMGRQALPARHGMLFDFARLGTVTMWMKDTPLPLDMLFLDESGRVLWLYADAAPGSLTLISAPMPARYVLEINGGEARGLGIAVGDVVLGAPLGASRSWP